MIAYLIIYTYIINYIYISYYIIYNYLNYRKKEITKIIIMVIITERMEISRKEWMTILKGRKRKAQWQRTHSDTS